MFKFIPDTIPKYKNNYRILLELRYKGNNINLMNYYQSEILPAIVHFNNKVQQPAHLNPKAIFGVDLFEDNLAIFLSSDEATDFPARGLQLFSSYFTDNNTTIGNCCKHGKLFVSSEKPILMDFVDGDNDYFLLRKAADILLIKDCDSIYSSLKKPEFRKQLNELLQQGFVL